MNSITTLEYQCYEVKVLIEPDNQFFFCATDLSKFLPITTNKNVSEKSLNYSSWYRSVDLLAIAVEKDSLESEKIYNFLSFSIREGFVDATIERLYHACRIYEAWRTTKNKGAKEGFQPELVYLIGCKQNNTMKIGYSKCVKDRLYSLQTSSPFQLTLLETVEGSKGLEKKLHNEFSHLKINREWFKWSEEIIEKFKMLQQL